MTEVTVKINYDNVPKNFRKSFEIELEGMIGNLWCLQTDDLDLEAYDIETTIDYDDSRIKTKETQR